MTRFSRWAIGAALALCSAGLAHAQNDGRGGGQEGGQEGGEPDGALGQLRPVNPGAMSGNPLQNAAPRRAGPARAAPPSVLAILAHPDDEITIAPVLARVARSGGAVTLIYATSGDAGPGTSGLEDPEAIGAMREKEARCSAFALGLEEPAFWNLGDGQLAAMARAPGSAAKRALDRIGQAIHAARPEVIMTWGPDGGYGHADHRMISALVTQTVAQMGPDRPDLLYAAFPQIEAGVLPGFDDWATTAPELLTDRIRYEATDLNAAETAIRCYESQFPQPAREGLVRLLHEQVWAGAIHFRMAFPSGR